MPTEDKNWHLSKTVPVSFILAIIGQTLALVWFVASMNSGIENNLRDLDRHAVESMAVGRTK